MCAMLVVQYRWCIPSYMHHRGFLAARTWHRKNSFKSVLAWSGAAIDAIVQPKLSSTLGETRLRCTQAVYLSVQL